MHLTDGTTTLRRLHPNDLAIFLAYRRDPEIARYQIWPAISDAEAADMLYHLNTATPLICAGEWAQIAIADAPTDRLIGDMGLFLSQDETEAELGITLQAASHGLGHATRAIRLAIDHLFEITNITRIIVGADTRNLPSLALIRRLSFVETGTVEVDGRQEMEFALARPAT